MGVGKASKVDGFQSIMGGKSIKTFTYYIMGYIKQSPISFFSYVKYDFVSLSCTTLYPIIKGV